MQKGHKKMRAGRMIGSDDRTEVIKILVTGATGTVGTEVIRYLNTKFEIIAAARNATDASIQSVSISGSEKTGRIPGLQR